MSKKPHFRKSCEIQHAKECQRLLELAAHNFYQIFSSLWGKLSWKISLLVICEILGLFVNSCTANDMYFLCNSGNLLQPIQTQLFKKQKKIFSFFGSFLKSSSNFKHFVKRWPSYLLHYRNYRLWKTSLSKKHFFRIPLGSEHVKGSQTLVKSAWQQFYHICSSLWWKLAWKMSLLVICEILGHFVNILTAD